MGEKGKVLKTSQERHANDENEGDRESWRTLPAREGGGEKGTSIIYPRFTGKAVRIYCHKEFEVTSRKRGGLSFARRKSHDQHRHKQIS